MNTTDYASPPERHVTSASYPYLVVETKNTQYIIANEKLVKVRRRRGSSSNRGIHWVHHPEGKRRPSRPWVGTLVRAVIRKAQGVVFEYGEMPLLPGDALVFQGGTITTPVQSVRVVSVLQVEDDDFEPRAATASGRG